MEAGWRQKLYAANEQYRQARGRLAEMANYAADLPRPDGSQAYRQALKAETQALRNYRKTLATYTDLIVPGINPPNSDGL